MFAHFITLLFLFPHFLKKIKHWGVAEDFCTVLRGHTTNWPSLEDSHIHQASVWLYIPTSQHKCWLKKYELYCHLKSGTWFIVFTLQHLLLSIPLNLISCATRCFLICTYRWTMLCARFSWQSYKLVCHGLLDLSSLPLQTWKHIVLEASPHYVHVHQSSLECFLSHCQLLLIASHFCANWPSIVTQVLDTFWRIAQPWI